jgi:hypothetical protein
MANEPAKLPQFPNILGYTLTMLFIFFIITFWKYVLVVVGVFVLLFVIAIASRWDKVKAAFKKGYNE